MCASSSSFDSRIRPQRVQVRTSSVSAISGPGSVGEELSKSMSIVGAGFVVEKSDVCDDWDTMTGFW